MSRNFYVISITLIITLCLSFILVHDFVNTSQSIGYFIVGIMWSLCLIALPSSRCYGYDKYKDISFEEGFKGGFSAGLMLGFGGMIFLLIVIAPFFAIKYIKNQVKKQKSI